MAAIEKHTDGLRDRQKSHRRQTILKEARHLFETHGYDATTMAAIAEAAEVSPPTVFNYFGSKDSLIVALVLQGHESARLELRDWQPDPAWSLGETLAQLFCFYIDATMNIAGKRVWRYAEATNIRKTGSDVSDLYDQIEANHIGEIAPFLHRFAPDTETGRARCALLARVAYHHWNAMFFKFIRDDAMPIGAHKDQTRQSIKALADLITLTP